MSIDVANAILRQLGGRRFIAMTGASGFVGEREHLRFRIPKAKQGINVINITLTPEDVYEMTFLRIRGQTVVEIARSFPVYADQLQDVFTHVTGLDTTMGAIMLHVPITHTYNGGDP